jgi:hypothetical protein
LGNLFLASVLHQQVIPTLAPLTNGKWR